MDEIFDYIKNQTKSFRLQKKHLVISLIFVELVGILTLTWYLRGPLSQKFLSEEVKAYSIVVMNHNSRYVVNNNDFLVGTTIPKSKVVTLITPGNIKQSMRAGTEGEWRYQLPENLKPGKYQFTVGYFDSKNKLAFFKTYNLRSETPNRLRRIYNNMTKFFQFPKASAQEAGLVAESYRIPTRYNIAISSLGAPSNNLSSGEVIYPQAIISNQNGEWITENNAFTVRYQLIDSEGNLINISSATDCNEINCPQQLPQDISEGRYEIIATLLSGDQEISQSSAVSISIGEPQNNLKVDADESQQNINPNSCLNDVCSVQTNTSVVSLDQLYNLQPLYDDFGQALNISGDCEQCAQPSYLIENNFLQTEIPLDNVTPLNPDLQNLVSCLGETKNNPSSILSLVASIALLKGSFNNLPSSTENLYLMLDNFLAYSPLTCSLYDYSPDFLKELNTSLPMFGQMDYKAGSNFESLESFYQTNRYPVVVETRFNNSAENHYVLVLAITDNYVWFADPLDPKDNNTVLKTTKDIFSSDFFTGHYWEIYPQDFGQLFKSSTANLTSFPLGRAFLRNANGNSVSALEIDGNGNITGKTSIDSINDKFYVVGKYRSDNFMYRINFQNYEGDYILPIRETIIEEGNIITSNPASGNRNQFVGVRINPPFFYDHDTESKRNDLYNLEFEDLNKLGVGKVRIVIEDLGEDHMSKINPLIEKALNNGYFIVFQYKPGSRIPKGAEEVRLRSFLQYLEKQGGSSSNYAIELYNEPNLRHYWNDCRNQSLESDEEIFRENSRAVGWVNDNGQMVYVKDCEREEDYAEALAIAIRQASDIIWSYDSNIKLIIGALSLQGSTPPEGTTIQDEHQRLLNVYLGEIQKYVDLSRFDYAIHGYQVWDAGPKTHPDGSEKGADGLLHVYNAYKNNDLIKQAKGGQCECFWITEFSVDQLNYDAYNLIRILENIKDTDEIDRTLNSVFIHEYNGITEPGNPELWQLWDNGVKNPAYNLLQYYLFQQYINNPLV